jgi:FkbM family methyltransferase
VNPSYKVKRVHGVWLPQEEEHLLQFLENTDQHINGIGTYQLDKLRTAIRFVKNRGMAVDVGAHAGLWSMWLGHVFRKLISIEPVPSSFYTMIKNVEPLLAEGTVHEAHQYAVGPEKKLVWMRLLDGDRNSTGSYFAVDEPRDGDIPVEMHRLDDLIPYDPIDFLKIDVQGGGCQGGRETYQAYLAGDLYRGQTLSRSGRRNRVAGQLGVQDPPISFWRLYHDSWGVET